MESVKAELESPTLLQENQSQVQCDQVEASEIQSQTMHSVQESENSSCRIRENSLVNGYIVYTRRRRSRHECNGFSENGKLKRLKNCEEVDYVKIQMENGKNHECNEMKSESPNSLVGEGGGSNEVPSVISNHGEARKGAMVRTFKRCKRSALKPKVDSGDEIVTESEEVVQIAIGKAEEKVNAAVSALTAPKNKLELKMSKKIVLNKKPMTVKELFDTGLLDGVSVVYMGGKKASGLRGVVKDGGILCLCCLCNGRRVIPPSKFEIHACNTYRRAAQYICLENGKSLLELLRACRAAPLHTLEATIQYVICSPAEEKYFTCKRCKGCFPSSCVGRVGPLCHSCVESRKSEDGSIHAVGKRVRSPRPVLFPNPSNISTQIKGHWKKRTKLSKRVSSSNSSKSASMPIVFCKKRLWTMKKKSSKLLAKLKTSRTTSNSNSLSPQNNSQWKITKKHQRLHKLIFEENGLPDGAEVAYYARGKKLLEGVKMCSGIVCGCCNTEISPSQFEVHAGWASRKKPYAYIYTSNGVSLHEFAIFLSKQRKHSAKDNDDLCIVCSDGGNLLLCDGCPRAFHKECASISIIPRGKWYCQICQNMFQESFVAHNADAVAAGRVEGVDPIEQITQRCIRIVKNVESQLSGCALCRGSDFSKSGFGPRTIILCDQCEKEYHVGCLRDHKMAFLKELPEGNWLCSNDCSRIHSALENLLVTGAERLRESLLDVIKKKQEEKCVEPLNVTDVRWRLLNGKLASPQTRPLLLEVVSMFHESFNPIVDADSGRDLIPAMIYGRNVRGQEFGGIYCAFLMVNSSMVSVAMLRIFGRDIAELPLVATSNSNRGKGYFQTLFSCIESLLASLNVKNLVLPAAEEAESIWTNKFGFSKVKPDELANYRKNCNQLVAFKGTIMLHKKVPPCQVISTQS